MQPTLRFEAEMTEQRLTRQMQTYPSARFAVRRQMDLTSYINEAKIACSEFGRGMVRREWPET
jgi:hypothetical protein